MNNLQEWARYLEANDETYRNKLGLLRKECLGVGPAKQAHVTRMVVALIKKRATVVTHQRLRGCPDRPRGRTARLRALETALPTGRDVPDFEFEDDFEAGSSRGLWNQPHESHVDLDGQLIAYHHTSLLGHGLEEGFARLFLGPSDVYPNQGCGE